MPSFVHLCLKSKSQCFKNDNVPSLWTKYPLCETGALAGPVTEQGDMVHYYGHTDTFKSRFHHNNYG